MVQRLQMIIKRDRSKRPCTTYSGNTSKSKTRVRTVITTILGVAAVALHLSARNGLDVFGGGTSSTNKENGSPLDKRARGNVGSGKNRRKFVNYTSSAWETLWLEQIQHWTRQRKICDVLLNDVTNLNYMHDFLQLICTSKLKPPYDNWCIMDDEYRPLLYDATNRTRGGYALFFQSESQFKNMNLTALIDGDGPQPVRPGPQTENIMSKFVFFDEETGEEYVEYIEPLVSHLRFPLAKCLPTKIWPIPYALFRGWVIPPPEPPRGRQVVYFDAGASSWSKGGGGPSLKFFANIWKRHGIDFQDIYAYEMTTTSDEFYQDVPPEYKNRTHYRQCAVSSSPEEATEKNPFIPHEIQHYIKNNAASEHELYILFKLDIDSPLVEQGSVDYLLDQAPGLIDEFAWEHHVVGNYLMRPAWSGPAGIAPLSLKQSYDIFLRMRNLGIRAHSWV